MKKLLLFSIFVVSSCALAMESPNEDARVVCELMKFQESTPMVDYGMKSEELLIDQSNLFKLRITTKQDLNRKRNPAIARDLFNASKAKMQNSPKRILKKQKAPVRRIVIPPHASFGLLGISASREELHNEFCLLEAVSAEPSQFDKMTQESSRASAQLLPIVRSRCLVARYAELKKKSDKFETKYNF